MSESRAVAIHYMQYSKILKSPTSDAILYSMTSLQIKLIHNLRFVCGACVYTYIMEMILG